MKTGVSILILVLSFCTEITFCQTNNNFGSLTVEEAFRPKMPTKIDTLYYPFYNGIQMIEVDHIGYWDKKIYFLEQSQPRAMPHSMFHPMPIGNEYFFRDTSGIIVKAFNTEKSLTLLTNHFNKVPLLKKSTGIGFLYPHHLHQKHRDGVWYQSPQSLFNFSGHYKVSTGYAEQISTQYNATDIKQRTDIKFGLIDSLGNITIPLEYNSIIPFYNNILVQKGNKCGIITYENKVLVTLSYDNYEFDHYNQTIEPQKMANVYFRTAIDTENNKPIYTYNAVFIARENKLTLLNNYDELYYKYSWSPIEDSSKRFIFITKNGKKGLLNENYQEIIPPRYEIFEFSRNSTSLFRVSQNGKFGFWDKNFNEIIPFEYDYAENFQSDSTALVLKNGKFYRIDTKNKKQSDGNLIPKWKTGYLSFVTDKYFTSVQTDNFLGLVDTSNNSFVLPLVYKKTLSPEKIDEFIEINKTLFEKKQLRPNDEPDMIDEILFYQNKIIVKNFNNKYGVIDSTFQILIDFKYENLEPIPCRLNYLIYSLNGKTGAMDYTGKNLWNEEYAEVRYDIHYEQERDIFKVKKNGKWGVVNFENKTLLPCEYDSIKFLGHWNRPKVKLWVVEKNSRFGVVDENNNIFIPFQYPGISHLEGYNLWVESEDKKRYKVVLGK
jgi:WG containing repeat